MPNLLLITIGKILSKLSSSLNIGSGSTWPGNIALLINKNFIKEYIYRNKHIKVILIAGTNGKTTTSKLIKHILEKDGKKVFHNETGANLLNGIASCLIKYSNFKGILNFDIAIFENDENTLPQILSELRPSAVVILNLFRDQLDRYGEVNIVANKWKYALENLDEKTSVYLNGDDPLISYLGKDLKSKIFYFGLDKTFMTKQEIPHDVDSIYCPNCSHKLSYDVISYSHLGDFNCERCGFKRHKTETFCNEKINYPLIGKYNIYNTNAAILLTNTYFSIPVDKISNYINNFKPAFGRQEIIRYKNKNIALLLSKNPTGFNQSIKVVTDSKIKNKNLLIVLNDRIPDGKDVSWIWDVDFEKLQDISGLIYISGDRAYDLAIRLKYEEFKNSSLKIYADLKEAIKAAVEETHQNETLYILPTYSAMLEVRKILKGRSIL